MNNFSLKQKSVSITLKLVTIISALSGTFLSAYAGRNSFMGGRTVFMYFTIQSNIAIAVICAVGLLKLLKNKKVSNLWYTAKFIGTVAITLTGIVFCFVLAPTMEKYAWNFQNILTHVVVPITAIIDFFIVSLNSNIKKTASLYVVIPPILYAIYAGIGYVNNWQFAEGINYPYFFLNWGSPAGAFGFTNELPFMGCAWWIIAIFVFLIIIGYIYLVITDILKKIFKKGKSE